MEGRRVKCHSTVIAISLWVSGSLTLACPAAHGAPPTPSHAATPVAKGKPAETTDSGAASTATPADSVRGFNLLHYPSYDSSERKGEQETSGSQEVSSYGTGLDLSNTEVGDRDLAQPALPAFSKVQWLNLRGTSITDKGLEHLRHLPRLRTLILESTEVRGTGFRQLKGLPLETIILEDTRVANDGLRNLAGSSVQTLNLTLTKITDEGLQYLAQLPKLTSLNLYSTEITDAGLLYLYDLQLEKLFLTGTQVTENEVERMRFKFPDLLIIY